MNERNEKVRVHKLAPQARRAMEFAQQEAKQLGNEFIGTEQLLLGLLDVQGSEATYNVGRFRVDVEMIRQRVTMVANAHQEHGPHNFTLALGRLGAVTVMYSRHLKNRRARNERDDLPLPLTRRLRKCIHLAVEETQRTHGEQVDTEQLLLGIVREGRGLACTILRQSGIDVRELQTRNLTA